MRIEVHADDAISTQARRYAEYRVFAALMPLSQRLAVRHADVALRHAARRGACDGVECSITLTTRDTGFRVRAMGDHPYDAINRAAERLAPTRLVKAGQEV